MKKHIHLELIQKVQSLTTVQMRKEIFTQSASIIGSLTLRLLKKASQFSATPIISKYPNLAKMEMKSKLNYALQMAIIQEH